MMLIVSCDRLTSLKKVKSKYTLPSIELLSAVPASDTDVTSRCPTLAVRDSVASLGLLDDPRDYFLVDERGMGASVQQSCSRV